MIQIAYITGRSDRSSVALSPLQRAFLARLDGTDLLRHPVNFPYSPVDAPYRRTPLVVASLNNGLDYVTSRRAAFAAAHRGAMSTLLDAAPQTVLLAGSCGLELLCNLGLPPAALRRVSVFAYGPVARRLPACRCVLVQGRGDRLSRWFFPRVTQRVDCGHLDYLDSPEVAKACDALIDVVRTTSRDCGVDEASR